MIDLISLGIDAAERGWIPDRLLRMGIRRLCAARLREASRENAERRRDILSEFVEEMKSSPIAPVPQTANRQHYELPAEFFAHVLGPHRKYSCGLWQDGAATLAQAEQSALEIACRRAELENHREILELGCGWGSLSLWMAGRFPDSRITAVSNSASQRRFIEDEARQRGYLNLRVVTADMNDFAPAATFDRIVSIEMFEHMRNYERLLARIAGWLKPQGRLFVHIFCHRHLCYPYETEGEADWMGRHFFTGGIMPSDDLLHFFQRDLRLIRQWHWCGTHYQRTADAWLANFDARCKSIRVLLTQAYGPRAATTWFHRWRLFIMACAELFGVKRGEEWGVSHYLFEPQTPQVVSRPDRVDPSKAVSVCERGCGTARRNFAEGKE